MTKKELETYPTLKKRVEKLKSDIETLRARDISSVGGKVKGSSKDFPYVERRFSVEIEIPEERERICKQIAKREKEMEELSTRMTKIEDFIEGIEDMQPRSIFEYRYLEGMTCEEIGKELGYTHGRISQIISKYLEAKRTTQNRILLDKGVT